MNWEKLAEETSYVITPANLVSAGGSLATWGGLEAYKKGQYRRAIALIGLGRTADLLDGTIARATNTASSRGEALDAASDKILLARSLKVLNDKSVLSEQESTGLFLHNGLSAVASIIAKARGTQIHPSKAGKRATALEWAGIGLAVLGSTEFTSDHPRLEQSLTKLRKATVISGIILGTYSAVDYLNQSIVQ